MLKKFRILCAVKQTKATAASNHTEMGSKVLHHTTKTVSHSGGLAHPIQNPK